MKKLPVLVLLISLLFLVSCKDKEMGIFFSIENERKLNDNTFPNNATVNSMVKVDFGGTKDYYFAATGYVWASEVEHNFYYHADERKSGRWFEVANPAGTICAGLGVLKNSSLKDVLYGVFYTPGATEPSGNLYKKTSYAGDWQHISTGLDGKLQALKGPNNVDMIPNPAYLFLLSLDNSDPALRKYDLFYMDNSESETTIVNGLVSAKYFDATWDGTDYYVSCGWDVYNGTTGDSLTADLSAGKVDNLLITSIYYSAHLGELVLAREGRGLHYLSPSPPPVPPTPITWPSLGTAPVTPFCFSDFKTENGNFLLLGTSEGYYEYNTAGGIAGLSFSLPTETCDGNNYKTLDLRKSPVHGFLVDDYTPGLPVSYHTAAFTYTVGNGIWSNRPASSGREWNRE